MNSDLRDRLASKLDIRDDKELDDLLDAIFTAEKDAYVACRKCGVKTPAPVPDVVARAKALDLLLNQGKGKPAQTVRHEHSGTVGLKPISEMSLEEIDAELRGLPAPTPEAA